jgi:hypothetical protein
MKALTFEELSFAETAHIQPLEHTACESSECAWLDLQGNIRPVPGREDDYAGNYDELAEIGDKYKVQPPPGDKG